ncbi:MAG: phage portal protein [Planctomycetaceae bacterium]
MLAFFRDTLRTARLKARYRRLVQEQLLQLVEASGPQPVPDDAAGWHPLGDDKPPFDDGDRRDLRAKARKLVAMNPHARNVLRLLEAYVVGPGFRLNAVPQTETDDAKTLAVETKSVWRAFLAANARHFSYAEFARRTWRDGECFLRLFPRNDGPPAARFIDPETISATADSPDSQGIVTAPGDVETPEFYLRVDPVSGKLLERIPAEEMIHTRIGVDSNQKRGVSFFASLSESLDRFTQWLDTELTARKLQASIVLWRRVQGSPSQVANLADGLDTGALPASTGVRSERYRAGTILTTGQGTELQFLQPDTNFGDAVPLGRAMLLCIAAGAGLPEFMLTSDASNANFASTMVAEGPAVKLFQSEQQFFSVEFGRLWGRVMTDAVLSGRLATDVTDRVKPEWTFPKLIARDRPKERLADVRLADAQIVSRAEVARRDDVDPERMRREIAEENEKSPRA